MWISKLQFVAATTLVLGTLGTGVVVATHHVMTREQYRSLPLMAAKIQFADKAGQGESRAHRPQRRVRPGCRCPGFRCSGAAPPSGENRRAQRLWRSTPSCQDHHRRLFRRPRQSGRRVSLAPPAVNTTVVAVDTSGGTITAGLESGKKAPPATLKLASNLVVELAGIGKGADPTAGNNRRRSAGHERVQPAALRRQNHHYAYPGGGAARDRHRQGSRCRDKHDHTS